MEKTGLVFNTVRIVAQIARVIKRHVTAFATLRSLAASIESKAIRSRSVVRQLSTLCEIPEISGELFLHPLEDLLDARKRLTKVFQEIDRWRRLGLLSLQAPVIVSTLEDLDKSLSHVDQYFRVVDVLGSMNTAQRHDMREIILCAISSFAIHSGSMEEGTRAVLDFEPRLRTRNSRNIHLELNADSAFFMGMASYETKPDKTRIVTTSKARVQGAGRYFYKACELGKKEAFRYYGDIYYDGKGVNRCFRRAVLIYEEGVARNDAGSKFALGWCYEYGKGVPVSWKKALQLYSEAMEGGCGEAMANMAFSKLHGKLTPSNHSEAARLLKKSINLEVLAAKDSLAYCYERGIGVERDQNEAFKLFYESFHGGDLLTTVELANCYDTGSGVEKNPYKATEIFERCISAGTWHGQIYQGYYGMRLIQGKGAETDIARGKALIIDATKSGSAMPWHALADCYRYGIGFRKDIKKARQFYERALECRNGIFGIVGAYCALGEIYENGEGVRCNLHRAYKYFLEAADRLSPYAQWKAATAFESGVGLKKDVHRAVFLLEMCSGSGNILAQQKYTAYYSQGHGIERSRMRSKESIEQAVSSGDAEAKEWLRSRSR